MPAREKEGKLMSFSLRHMENALAALPNTPKRFHSNPEKAFHRLLAIDASPW